MNDSLQQWLEVATKKLAPEAAEQVRAEITAHAQSAVTQLQFDGLNESAALELAVQQLGSATVAARDLARVHLTAAEVSSFNRASPLVNVLRLSGALALVASMILGFMGAAIRLDTIISNLCMLLATLFMMWTDRYETLERRAFFRLLAFFTFFTGGVIPFVIALATNQALFLVGLYVPWTILSAGATLLFWRVWRKTVWRTRA